MKNEKIIIKKRNCKKLTDREVMEHLEFLREGQQGGRAFDYVEQIMFNFLIRLEKRQPAKEKLQEFVH